MIENGFDIRRHSMVLIRSFFKELFDYLRKSSFLILLNISFKTLKSSNAYFSGNIAV